MIPSCQPEPLFNMENNEVVDGYVSDVSDEAFVKLGPLSVTPQVTDFR